MYLPVEFSLKLDRIKSNFLAGIPYIFLTNTGCQFVENELENQIKFIRRLYLVKESSVKLDRSNEVILAGKSYDVYKFLELEFVVVDDHLSESLHLFQNKKVCEYQIRIEGEFYEGKTLPEIKLTEQNIKSLTSFNSELDRIKMNNYDLKLGEHLDEKLKKNFELEEFLIFNQIVKESNSDKIKILLLNKSKKEYIFQKERYLDRISTYVSPNDLVLERNRQYDFFEKKTTDYNYFMNYYNSKSFGFQDQMASFILDKDVQIILHFAKIGTRSVLLIFNKFLKTCSVIVLSCSGNVILLENLSKICEQLGVPDYIYEWKFVIFNNSFHGKLSAENSRILKLYIFNLMLTNPEYQNPNQILHEIKKRNDFEQSIVRFIENYRSIVHRTFHHVNLKTIIKEYSTIRVNFYEKMFEHPTNKIPFIFKNLSSQNLLIFPFGFNHEFSEIMRLSNFTISENLIMTPIGDYKNENEKRDVNINITLFSFIFAFKILRTYTGLMYFDFEGAFEITFFILMKISSIITISILFLFFNAEYFSKKNKNYNLVERQKIIESEKMMKEIKKDKERYTRLVNMNFIEFDSWIRGMTDDSEKIANIILYIEKKQLVAFDKDSVNLVSDLIRLNKGLFSNFD